MRVVKTGVWVSGGPINGSEADQSVTIHHGMRQRVIALDIGSDTVSSLLSSEPTLDFVNSLSCFGDISLCFSLALSNPLKRLTCT